MTGLSRMLAIVSLVSLISLGGGLGCHGGATQPSSASSGELGPDGEQPLERADTPAPARDRSVALARNLAHVPHEVELDPRGEAALTLDRFGGLHLWPNVRVSDVAEVAPYALPLQEPLWMSLARDGAGGFVVAVLDTTNAGHVVAVRPGESPNAEGRMTPLFSISPNDPLLEIHVLDGGERLLALGLDHTVRLYDRAGALVSVIDERSFAPWQLRVVHTEPGAAPKLAAMLAAPLRVQALELQGDVLRRVGEPRSVVLDRGPNRNDLTLSPDGKTVAALRRPKARGREFSIELIDLETDARRLIAGKSDTTIRARMHFVEAERILLETGSGRGLWVELGNAETLTDPTDADPRSSVAKRLHATKHDSIALPGSSERKPQGFDPRWDPDWDRGMRFHASVVAGVRVTLDRRDADSEGEDRLIVDPLAEDRHLVFGFAKSSFEQVALNHDGKRLAWVQGERVLLRNLELADGDTDFEHGRSTILALAFVDDSRLLLVDDKGALLLYEWPAGQLIDETKLDFAWALAGVAYHHDVDGRGWLGYRGNKTGTPARILEISATGLGATTTLDRDQRGQWLDMLSSSNSERAALLGLSERDAEAVDELAGDRFGRLYYTQKHPRTPLFVRADGDTRAHELPAGQGRELAPSPDGTRLAVIQFRRRADGWRHEDHLLSVLDVATGERLWTIGSRVGLRASWSGDGSRLAVNLDVRDAATGELVAAVASGLVVAEGDDAASPK
jgi:hypothetical protein